MTEKANESEIETQMPELGHCACKFSSGGVLSKECQFHKSLREIWEDDRAHLGRELADLKHDIERAVAENTRLLNEPRCADVIGCPQGQPCLNEGQVSAIQPKLMPHIRKRLERECEDAENPKGMSVHDGMTRVHSADIRYLLKLIDTLTAAAPAEASARGSTIPVPREFVLFLLGEGEYRNATFGDRNPLYWWRTDLRAMLAAAPAEASAIQPISMDDIAAAVSWLESTKHEDYCLGKWKAECGCGLQNVIYKFRTAMLAAAPAEASARGSTIGCVAPPMDDSVEVGRPCTDEENLAANLEAAYSCLPPGYRIVKDDAPSPEVEAQWQPIETAPKDGIEFLAAYGHQGFVKKLVSWNALMGYWQSKGVPEFGFIENATHWMPIPSKPPMNGGGKS